MSKRNKNKNNDKPKKGNGNRIVQVRRDNVVDWHDIWADVYIAADNRYEEELITEMMMVGGNCRKAKTVDEADIVIFGGGADVEPALYGERIYHKQTRADPQRDKADKALFEECYEKGVPMAGICRGAQFGHVMLGGKLYQHVDMHNSEHGMWLPEEQRMLPKVSSVHHQMCMKNDGMTVLGTAPGRSTSRYVNNTMRSTGKAQDIEAFFYRDACFLGVQGHPEYRDYVQFRYWFLQQVKDLLAESTDLVLTGNVRRVKQEILDQRCPLDKLRKEIA